MNWVKWERFDQKCQSRLSLSQYSTGKGDVPSSSTVASLKPSITACLTKLQQHPLVKLNLYSVHANHIFQHLLVRYITLWCHALSSLPGHAPSHGDEALLGHVFCFWQNCLMACGRVWCISFSVLTREVKFSFLLIIPQRLHILQLLTAITVTLDYALEFSRREKSLNQGLVGLDSWVFSMGDAYATVRLKTYMKRK